MNTATRGTFGLKDEVLNIFLASMRPCCIKVAPCVYGMLFIWSLTPARVCAPGWSRRKTLENCATWSNAKTRIWAPPLLEMVKELTKLFRNVCIWLNTAILVLPETSTAMIISSGFEHSAKMKMRSSVCTSSVIPWFHHTFRLGVYL